MKNLKIPLLFSIMLSANSFAATPFTPNSQPTGWLARPVLSNTSLLSNSETIYLLNYNKDEWSGDVLAKTIDSDAVTASTGPWDPDTAASKLDLLNSDTGRKIVTRDGSTNIPFRLGSLSATQKTSLSAVVADQTKILDYVRGSRVNEIPTGTYRDRLHVLGDILHSTLTYRYHDANTKRLYVGANDGMLHVFNATDGSEIFAYIPSMLIPNLKLLTSNPYSHTYFVDGGISIANINLSGTLKTFLVGGLGAGGKGLYALDVTTPSAADETAALSKIKWEITPTINASGASSTDFANLGYTYGTPRIARLNDNTAVAIVGNGYMNGGNGHAVLYLINVDTGALIKEIDTGYGTTASPNGLSTPTLFDSNSDGKVDYAYAGDLDGHLFKFDLSTSTPSSYAATLLFTTSPVQPITSAPAVISHPSGGAMVAFATGQLLTTGDTSDATTVHYAYGIWDGKPVANDTLLTQTLTTNTFGTGNVRTITANIPDWTAGSGHHYGWKVALPVGERVTGELPFEKNGRFYFLTANPAVVNATPPNGSNWLYELDMMTGGSSSSVLFDLNGDGAFNSLDLADSCTPSGVISCIPIAKPVGAGVSSQPTFAEADGFNTTLYTYHPDTLTNAGTTPYDPGVSGGHFDFDIYYYGTGTTTTTYTPTATSETKTLCKKTSDVAAEYNKLSPTFCKTTNGYSSGYGFMTAYTTGTSCGSGKNNQTITCNTYTTTTGVTTGLYANKKHQHEYDDTYDVTGVNMLNASIIDFNLSPNVIASSTDTTIPFKILVMNQYLSPAAKLSVGGATYESVKTYKNLASETNATTLLAGLPTYTRNTIGTLIYNLPLDAFKSKDWWGDGASVRAGLIPTQTGCVNKVNTDGSMINSSGKGLIGPNGERFNGALTIQIIKSTTPASALELNHSTTNKNGDGTAGTPTTMSDSDRARYGWRVKQTEFTNYVLAEYTSFWHHPNGICYGNAGWVADAPEDTSPSSCTASEVTCAAAAKALRVTGSADPTDGIFASGLAVKSTTTTTSGSITTTIIIYVDDTRTTIDVVNNGDGTTTTTTTFRDGTSSSQTTGGATTVGSSSIIKGAEEVGTSGTTGRQSWWEIFQ